MAFATLLFLLLSQFFSTAGSYSTVNHLPGFPGPLPFQLETGYVGVGDSDEFQIFHYFVKSDQNPKTDPLLLWLTGGPGCSALSGLEEEAKESIPQLILNPYSWTKNSSILFVDLPVGTGFSYDTITPSSFKPGDFKFITNPFYVGGDSYSGMIVPVLAQRIVEGMKFILGYILGNPYTIRGSSKNFTIPFAHRMTLISDELFESLETSCKGNYVNIDPSNVECLRHYKIYEECISKVEPACIIYPKCVFKSSKQQYDVYNERRSLSSIPTLLLHQNSQLSSLRCPEFKYKLSTKWANTDQVQKALNIREGSIGEWIRCNE
ncbi:serine carboxypeptidase-like 13 isoform X2 [Cucumis melo var. makuwa]|uniref:Serine carboxypeptidase-like 13 isoform X2 n=1 Tax=Cucumis melo var. makuwa TaxID=1194695 RepID=A0A5A7VB51_CUCMM|nr:serine carboxypeptidase-like 13 isoform X2 [Cucumis melo var. makuwa]